MFLACLSGGLFSTQKGRGGGVISSITQLMGVKEKLSDSRGFTSISFVSGRKGYAVQPGERCARLFFSGVEGSL